MLLYAVVHMVSQLFRGSVAASALWHPIIPGVMMDGRHGRVLCGCRQTSEEPHTIEELQKPQAIHMLVYTVR